MATNPNDAIPPASEPWLQVQGSRHFLDWLAEVRVSLAFTTYQTGKIFFVGRKPDMNLAVFACEVLSTLHAKCGLAWVF